MEGIETGNVLGDVAGAAVPGESQGNVAAAAEAVVAAALGLPGGALGEGIGENVQREIVTRDGGEGDGGEGDGGEDAERKGERRSRSSFNQREKLEICEMAKQNPGWTHQTLRRWVRYTFGRNIGQSTISDILAKPEKWRQLSSTRPDVAKRRPAQWPEVESRLVAWIQERGGADQLSGPAIRAQAVSIAKELNFLDFHGTPGWYDGFCSRHNVRTARSRNKESTRKKRKSMPAITAGRLPRGFLDDEEHAILFDEIGNSLNMLQAGGSGPANLPLPPATLPPSVVLNQNNPTAIVATQANGSPAVGVGASEGGGQKQHPLLALKDAQEGIKTVQRFAKENTALFTELEVKMIATIAAVMDAKAAQVALTGNNRNGQHPFVARFQSFLSDTFPI